MICFNTQPPEGGWVLQTSRNCLRPSVSTLSRPKAAGGRGRRLGVALGVSTLSRPKAAGSKIRVDTINSAVSTLSRPKAAGKYFHFHLLSFHVSTLSRPKAAGVFPFVNECDCTCFNTQPPEGGWLRQSA